MHAYTVMEIAMLDVQAIIGKLLCLTYSVCTAISEHCVIKFLILKSWMDLQEVSHDSGLCYSSTATNHSFPSAAKFKSTCNGISSVLYILWHMATLSHFCITNALKIIRFICEFIISNIWLCIISKIVVFFIQMTVIYYPY